MSSGELFFPEPLMLLQAHRASSQCRRHQSFLYTTAFAAVSLLNACLREFQGKFILPAIQSKSLVWRQLVVLSQFRLSSRDAERA